MASRRKSTTPCMRPQQEAAAVDWDLETEEEEEQQELGEEVLDPAEGGFECKYCSFRTPEVKQFTVHVGQQHPQVVLNASYVCVDCDFHTKRYDALLEHNVRQHPGGEDRLTRTMLRRHNHTVFQQSVARCAGEGEGPEGAGPEGAEPEPEGACRGSIALSKTPIMRAHRRRHTPIKFPCRLADDVIKLQQGPGGVLHVKAGCGPPGAAVLPPGALAQVLSALQSQQGGGAGAAGHSQLLIPLSSIPTYNASMDNNVLLLSAYSRFPYPSVCEIGGLSSQTRFSEEQIKVWFSAQRLKHGVSWTPEEVEDARRRKQNGAAVPQTITVIPGANGLPSLFQTCQVVSQQGLVLTQSPITLTVAAAPRPPAQPRRQAASPLAAATDPLGAKPKKSKEQLAELKASYGRRQFATEAEIARLMRSTGLTKRAIKKWFSDTRYNQRNAREQQGGAAPGEDPPPPALHRTPGDAAPRPDPPQDGPRPAGGVAAAAIVIDSSDDASDGSPPVAVTTPPSDPRVKFRHAFPDFTPQRFKEKTAEQLLALDASFLSSRTPSDEELSRLRAHTKLTRRELDAWFTERRRKAAELDAAAEVAPPGAAPPSSTSSTPERQATPPAARKVLKKTPEQLHLLKTAFVRSQWPSGEDYDAMATQSGLPRSYIVNWFGDTRYAWKNSNLKWFYLYQTGKVDEALNGGPVKTQKKSRKRFRGWSRRTRRPYPCRRSPQPSPPSVKGEAVLREHYLLHSGLQEEQQEEQVEELAGRAALSPQQVRHWFSEARRRQQEGLPPFTAPPPQEARPQPRGEGEGEEATDEEEGEEEEEMELEAHGDDEAEEEEAQREEKEAQGEEKEAQREEAAAQGEEKEAQGEEEEAQGEEKEAQQEQDAVEPTEEEARGDSKALGQSQPPQKQPEET